MGENGRKNRGKMLEKSEKGKKWKRKQSEIQLLTSTSNDPRFAPLLDPPLGPLSAGLTAGRPNGRPDGRPDGYYSSNIRGTLLGVIFGGKR